MNEDLLEMIQKYDQIMNKDDQNDITAWDMMQIKDMATKEIKSFGEVMFECIVNGYKIGYMRGLEARR